MAMVSSLGRHREKGLASSCISAGKKDQEIDKSPLRPTYQLWPFSSTAENHPEMPIWDPQDEFPGIPLSGLFLSSTIFFKRKPWTFWNFSGISLERAFGIPKARFRGRMRQITTEGDAKTNIATICNVYPVFCNASFP